MKIPESLARCDTHQLNTTPQSPTSTCRLGRPAFTGYGRPLAGGLLMTATVLAAVGLQAATRTWIGGNADWDTNPLNWNPNDEPDSDDSAVFNTPNTVDLANATEGVLALDLSGGIVLDLNGNNLTVDTGETRLIDNGTVLRVPGGSTLNTDDIIVGADSVLSMSGGEITMVESGGEALLNMTTTSSVIGYGAIRNTDAIGPAAEKVFSCSGVLRATTFDALGTDSGTLTITVNDPEGRIDLDNMGSEVFVGRNDTLDINGEGHGSDPFSSSLTLYDGATFDMSKEWSMDTGTIDANTNGVIVGTSGAPATIAGAAFTQTGGTITLADEYDILRFTANYWAQGGTVENHGLVIFAADSVISNDIDFQMIGGDASLTVDPGAEVIVNDQDFNADGNGLLTNVITIQSNGILDLNLSATADTGLSGKINLNGGELDVDVILATEWALDGVGNLSVGADTGNSFINGDRVVISNPVTVNENATLIFNAPATWDPGSSASIAGGSLLRLDATNQTVFNGGTFTGDGTLRTLRHSLVQANTTVSTGTFEWGSGGFVQTIQEGAVMTVNSASINGDNVMDSMVNIDGNGGGLTVNGPSEWTMAASCSTNTVGSGTATIGGSSRFNLESALNVLGDTDISAPVLFGSGSTTTIDSGFLLDVTGSPARYDGGTITGQGEFSPSLSNTVEGDFTIEVDTFDFEGGNWIVDPEVTLTVDVDDYDDFSPNNFERTITLNSGSVGLMSADPAFVMDGVLNMNNTTGAQASWGGQAMEIGNDGTTRDAQLNVAGSGISRFFNSVDFNGDAEVDVAAGAALVFNVATDFDTDTGDDGTCDARFTGDGTMVFNSTVNINEALVVDMGGGRLDLDGEASDVGANWIHVDAPAVLNLSQFTFGQTKVLNDRLEVNRIDTGKTGSLTINLPGDAEWTLNPGGILSLLNTNAAATLLAGSDANIEGGLMVIGDVRCEARIDISGTVNVGTSGQPFRLSGGNLFDLNTIEGGVIDGPGLLGADDLAGLKGYGTIQTDIDFDNISELIANGGLLDVNGEILDIGTLRSDGTAAVLDLANPFDTGLSENGIALLNGGQIQGALITLNSFDLRGNGTVRNRVINNDEIRAGGGTLTLENTENDLDGLSETGKLHADTGDLILNDNATFPFNGTVRADSGHEVFADGFELSMEASSSLVFFGGTFRGTASTNFKGSIQVNPGTASIKLPGTAALADTCTADIAGTLVLDTGAATIAAGATFTGGGTLRTGAGCTLTLQDGAEVDVLLENNGVLILGASPGQVDMGDFQQNTSGTLRIDIEGTGLDAYDRITLTGTCSLAGTLEVALGGGFSPVLGDTFSIITAPGGVINTFDTEDFLAADPGIGLDWEVKYNPTNLQLEVVEAGAFKNWIDSFTGLTDPADKTTTANPDNDRLNNFSEFALDGHPASGVSSGKYVGKTGTVGGADAWTLTFPVRVGATPDPADPPGGEQVLQQVSDGVVYTIRGSHDLATFPLDVSEVTGPDAAAIQAGLPAVNPGWEYRTFSRPAPVAGGQGEFLRVEIAEL